MKAIECTRENLSALLRRFHITPTHQRIEIAHALFSAGEHLSADRLLTLVNVRHPETSRATVYNTLKLFVEKRLVREVIVDPTKVFYDPNPTGHYHIYDATTGQLTDIDPEGVRIVGLPPLPDHLEAEAIDLVVRVRPRSPA